MKQTELKNTFVLTTVQTKYPESRPHCFAGRGLDSREENQSDLEGQEWDKDQYLQVCVFLKDAPEDDPIKTEYFYKPYSKRLETFIKKYA